MNVLMWASFVCIVLAPAFGYFVLGPIACGKRPFSPPDGTPGTFEPWKPWKRLP